MVRTLFACSILTAAMLPAISTTAFADFTICNHARFPVFAAIGYQEKEKGWVSVGWFEIPRLSCEAVISGPLDGRSVYTFAEGNQPPSGYWFWWPEYWREGNAKGKRDGEMLCVADHQRRFAIYRNEVRGSCKASGYIEKFFTKHNPGNGVNYTSHLGFNFPLTPAEEKQLQPRDYFNECGGCPKMIVIPAGEFMMGSPENEPERRSDEGPRHKVTIRQPFPAAQGRVSRDQYEKFVNATGRAVADKCLIWKDGSWTEESGRSFRSPGFPQDGGHPVVCVSFYDAQEYVAWLSKQAGRPYRLLSEAEWEYATRAGTETPFWWGSSITTEQANYNGNLTYAGGPKGEFRRGTIVRPNVKPNPWGIFSGRGNVAEWVEDCWNANYEGAPIDGSAWTKGDCGRRVTRGGSWASDPKFLRSAARLAAQSSARFNDVGFRVARTLSVEARQVSPHQLQP